MHKEPSRKQERHTKSIMRLNNFSSKRVHKGKP